VSNLLQRLNEAVESDASLNSPKFIRKRVRQIPELYDVCPHCNEEIREKGIYSFNLDEGIDQHRVCGGLLKSAKEIRHDEFVSFLGKSLNEGKGPTLKTLEDNVVELTDQERQKVMDAKATWSFGQNGAPSPAIKKSVVDGETWFYSKTHRVYQQDKTLDAAIKSFHEVVEPSS
jgi:hypothetical protein